LLAFTLIPALAIIVFSLNITILKSTLQTASIALPKLDYADGVSMHGIYIGIIVVGVFQLIGILFSSCLSFSDTDYNHFNLFLVMTLIWASTHFVFTMITESLTYKFITCFNYSNNQIVKARSALMMCLMLITIIATCVGWFRTDILNDSRVKKLMKITLCFFLGIPCLIILSLNIVLMARLKPELSQKIEPSNIHLGFFNQSEINSIENSAYVKDEYFNQRIVGRLSDIIYSELKTARTKCYTTTSYNSQTKRYETDRTCYTSYTKYYFSKINCSNSNSLFYKDCSNNQTSLIISLSFFTYDSDFYLTEDYPLYNCLLENSNQTKCNQSCSSLFNDNYELVMFQQNGNSIEPAWKDFNNFIVIVSSFGQELHEMFSFVCFSHT